MICSRLCLDARECLDALSKCLGVLKLGAHSSYDDDDGVELLVCACGRRLSQIVELKRAERLGKAGLHSSEWYELPFPKSFRTILTGSAVRFKPYQFLELEDIAYHLKMHLADVEAAVAKTVLKQALGAGVHVEKHDGLDHKIFKLRSLEEMQILDDLLV